MNFNTINNSTIIQDSLRKFFKASDIQTMQLINDNRIRLVVAYDLDYPSTEKELCNQIINIQKSFAVEKFTEELTSEFKNEMNRLSGIAKLYNGISVKRKPKRINRRRLPT